MGVTEVGCNADMITNYAVLGIPFLQTKVNEPFQTVINILLVIRTNYRN